MVYSDICLCGTFMYLFHFLRIFCSIALFNPWSESFSCHRCIRESFLVYGMKWEDRIQWCDMAISLYIPYRVVTYFLPSFILQICVENTVIECRPGDGL